MQHHVQPPKQIQNYNRMLDTQKQHCNGSTALLQNFERQETHIID